MQSQQKDSAVGSPKADSDEGILMMKGSSQDDTLSQSPKERLKFKCESEESSGILDDSDVESKTGAALGPTPKNKMLERTMSLEAEFVLEDTKLRLIE